MSWLARWWVVDSLHAASEPIDGLQQCFFSRFFFSFVFLLAPAELGLVVFVWPFEPCRFFKPTSAWADINMAWGWRSAAVMDATGRPFVDRSQLAVVVGQTLRAGFLVTHQPLDLAETPAQERKREDRKE